MYPSPIVVKGAGGMGVQTPRFPYLAFPAPAPFFLGFLTLTLLSIAKDWALSRNPPPPLPPISTGLHPFRTPHFPFFPLPPTLPVPHIPGFQPSVLPCLAAFILNLFSLVIRHFTSGRKKEMFYLRFTLACLRPGFPLETFRQISRSCIIWYYIFRFWPIFFFFFNWDSIMESSVTLKKSTVTAIKMVVSYPWAQ